jgi:hypothetical protein
MGTVQKVSNVDWHKEGWNKYVSTFFDIYTSQLGAPRCWYRYTAEGLGWVVAACSKTTSLNGVKTLALCL